MKAIAIALTAIFLVALTATTGFVYSLDEDAERVFLSYCKTCHPPQLGITGSQERGKLKANH